MTVAPAGPVAAVAALPRLAALPLPDGGGSGGARQNDQIVLSPPPTLGALWQMALAGNQQLAALLPTLERMLRTDPEPLPIGHLARALGDAAHAIDAGYAGIVEPATPRTTPAPSQPQAASPKSPPESPTSPAAETPSDPEPLPIGHLARALGDAAHAVDAGYAGIAAPATPRTTPAPSQPQAASPKSPPKSPTSPAVETPSDLELAAESDPEPLELAFPEREQPGAAIFRALVPPNAHPIPEAWRHAATATLQQAADVLTHAEQLLATTQNPLAATAVSPDLQWALSQIIGAQRQVGGAIGRLSLRPRPRATVRARPSRTAADLRHAVAIVGAAVALLLGLIAYGSWVFAGAAPALATALVWGWRVVVASRGLRIELRR